MAGKTIGGAADASPSARTQWKPGTHRCRREHSSQVDGEQVTYRVLVTDEIDPEGVAILAAEPQIEVNEVPTLPKEELLARIGDYDAIVGRSATRIGPDV